MNIIPNIIFFFIIGAVIFYVGWIRGYAEAMKDATEILKEKMNT